ncbi:protein FAR1-RELATED SEQUENCE 5-like [Cornus florida]|uniref:protein FAR1-RELATED SEQUENCE 5-like n=1 Tax=Cornus florida TaxID=4283 RepID=UPI0028A20F0A|nr:protein FAR1-RELATED SEQUENCE 5-like [Cornus florida]
MSTVMEAAVSSDGMSLAMADIDCDGGGGERAIFALNGIVHQYDLFFRVCCIKSEESCLKTNINMEMSAGDISWKPKFGMEFETQEKAYEFYNEYGRRTGFSVRKENCNKNLITGELTSRLCVCCKEGFRGKDKRDYLTKNPRAETRTGCGAQMNIKLNRGSNKYWMILEYELLGRHVGGKECLGFTKLDQKNYLRYKRQRNLAVGEAGSLLRYFQQHLLENPSFFHAVQLDNEEQITNIFLADAKLIIDYGQFGDVVIFDTTYKVNKANRPFAVFVGFNHHRETIIFGAALMYDETADSFIWLFETFLEAMSKKNPKTIFTD